MVNEFPFTAASVGRLALSLHQAIRNHRLVLPDDEDLLDELVAVRLRKNSLGIYRLDHDAGQHDDQAISLALGVHHLLDADPEPEFVILHDHDVPAGETNIFGIEVLKPMGLFAVRSSADDPRAQIAAFQDEDDAERRTVRTVRVIDAG